MENLPVLMNHLSLLFGRRNVLGCKSLEFTTKDGENALFDAQLVGLDIGCWKAKTLCFRQSGGLQSSLTVWPSVAFSWELALFEFVQIDLDAFPELYEGLLNSLVFMAHSIVLEVIQNLGSL